MFKLLLALPYLGLFGVATSATPAQPQIVVPLGLTNGINPQGDLCLGPDNDLYGTASSGGANGGFGTVFKVATDGLLTVLAQFGNTNGADPQAGLVLGLDGNFYGTTVDGGTNGDYGTIFKVTTNGLLTTIASFGGTNGAFPYSRLALGIDGNLYGTTYFGGANNLGTVFKVSTDGALTSLVSFANSNGAAPHGGLTMGIDGYFYGTTALGGTNGGWGTIFRVSTNGALTSLVSFNNGDGAYPRADLTPGGGGNLYGTTYYGGSNSLGTIFSVTTNGVLDSLVSFAGTNGANPAGDLVLGSDGNLYGTTYGGGCSNSGAIFQVTTNGVLTLLTSFTGCNGASPIGGMIVGNDGDFYGTTANGTGSRSNGLVYKLVLPPIWTECFVSNSSFEAFLAGLARPSVQIEAATGFTGNWSVLTNLPFTNGIGQFIDPTVGSASQRFYRMAVQ